MLSRRKIMTASLSLTAASLAPLAAHAQNSTIIATIRKRGTVRIATLAGNQPYSAFKSDGTPIGYDVEIGQALAAALDVKPDWISVDAPGRISALQTGAADVSIANFTDTIERSLVIAFTRPYLVVGSTYMVKRASLLQSVEQANRKGIKVAVLRGSTLEDVFTKVTPDATMVAFETTALGFAALRSGAVDTQIYDSLQNAAILSKDTANFRNLPGNWSYEEICIGLPAGDADWLRIVDTFVRQLVNSGEDARLFKKYFGYDIPPM